MHTEIPAIQEGAAVRTLSEEHTQSDVRVGAQIRGEASCEAHGADSPAIWSLNALAATELGLRVRFAASLSAMIDDCVSSEGSCLNVLVVRRVVRGQNGHKTVGLLPPRSQMFFFK